MPTKNAITPAAQNRDPASPAVFPIPFELLIPKIYQKAVSGYKRKNRSTITTWVYDTDQ